MSGEIYLSPNTWNPLTMLAMTGEDWFLFGLSVFLTFFLVIFGLLGLVKPTVFADRPKEIWFGFNPIGLIVFLVSMSFVVLQIFPERVRIVIVRFVGVILILASLPFAYMLNLNAITRWRLDRSRPSVSTAVVEAPTPQTPPTASPTPAPAAAPTPLPPIESADALINEARAAWKRGDVQGSLTHVQNALTLLVGHLGEAHPRIAEVDKMIAAVRLQSGQPAR